MTSLILTFAGIVLGAVAFLLFYAMLTADGASWDGSIRYAPTAIPTAIPTPLCDDCTFPQLP